MSRLLLLLLILLMAQPNPGWAVNHFRFDKDQEQWYFWGEGIGGHHTKVGYTRAGSLWMSTDFGETHTVNYQWKDLTPGNYLMTMYVRGRVQPGVDTNSFWHFYDGGEGTKSVFTDLHGNYEWRKIEYVLKVTGSELSVWFRLMTPGQVWIDDFSLSKTNRVVSAPSIGSGRALSYRPETWPRSQKARRWVLLDFERSAGPFGKVVQREKNKMAQVSSRQYINLEPSSYIKGDWRSYDRIELQIINETNKFYPFYLVLGDRRAHDYWSQLNHKTVLSPGVNHLSFDLRQYVGERGSHRHRRPLDLSDLKKMYLVIDPDERFPISDQFFVDDLTLVAVPPPFVPKGVYAFDFTSQKAQGATSFTRVTTQDLYESKLGYGFVSPKYWRVEDSIYTPEIFRYSIGLLAGKFRVRLPNGNYSFSLVMDKLGVWDPPFWKQRKVIVNGKPFLVEARSSGRDYLKDLLFFEQIEPDDDDHPFDLYLSKIFSPKIGSARVKDGILEFEFEGDPSGISLNSLVIWNTRYERVAKNFLTQMERRNKLEFDWVSRKIQSPSATSIASDPALIDLNLVLSAKTRLPSSKEVISFTGAPEERHLQLIQVPAASEVSFAISELKGEGEASYSAENIEVLELGFQYVSPDLNHETYMVAGKFLRPFRSGIKSYKGQGTRYFALRFNGDRQAAPGNYRGHLTVKNNKVHKIFPIELNILPIQLPNVGFPVGFFGLDPIPFNYFDSPDMPALRQEYRLKALELIARAGFTTFTGLPEARVETSGEEIILDTSELDELFKKAQSLGVSGPVFTYGGQFPQKLLNEEDKPDVTTSESFRAQVSERLKILLKQPSWPEIIHTFSDEAGGYSNRIAEDIQIGIALKRDFPFLQLGGFSSMKNRDAQKLNAFFDVGIYSELTREGSRLNKRWGSYNASPGNLDDPRFTFGPGLFLARDKGLTAYLEWHLTGFNNLPYYDLDGREADVSMVMPSLDGSLLTTLRFEMAINGLQTFRKLLYLEELLSRNEGSFHPLEEVRTWLSKLRRSNRLFEEPHFLSGKGKDFIQFEKELNLHLTRLTEGP